MPKIWQCHGTLFTMCNKDYSLSNAQEMQGAPPPGQPETGNPDGQTDVGATSAPSAPGQENAHSRNIPFALFSEFEQVQEIGSGTYKTVYKAVWTQRVGGQATQTVAICVPRNNVHISREAAVFDQLGYHENVTHLLALTINHQNLTSLVTEYASLGGLDGVVMDSAERSIRVLNDVWITVCAQVCSGMLHMERHGLIHRDLAARNVLVFNFDKSLPTLVRVKIADYGQWH